MSVIWARLLSAETGVAAFAVAGWLMGGWWWIAAGAGIAAVAAAQFDPRMTYPLALAALATTVGAAGSEHRWLVVLVVAGVIASIELAAGADRVTVVRPRVPVLGHTGVAVVFATALASAVVLLGEATWSRGDWAAVVAAAAAVVSVRLLAR